MDVFLPAGTEQEMTSVGPVGRAGAQKSCPAGGVGRRRHWGSGAPLTHEAQERGSLAASPLPVILLPLRAVPGEKGAQEPPWTLSSPDDGWRQHPKWAPNLRFPGLSSWVN
jgi:hypothetical protein